MKVSYQSLPMIGLLFTMAAAVYMVVLVNAQERMAGDFTTAVTAEVRDGQGQIVLRGEFSAAAEDDDEVERRASLAPTGVDADAAGEAEVEFDKARPVSQEVEFTGRNLQPGAAYALLIDGREIGSVTADARGRASGEWQVRIP